jgi:hypothetical protein
VLPPCITPPPRSLQGTFRIAAPQPRLRGNFLFPRQFPRAAVAQTKLQDCTSEMKLMEGLELKTWDDEANQRALVEEPAESGALPRGSTSTKSNERFLARFKVGMQSKVEKRKADSIDVSPAVNARGFSF